MNYYERHLGDYARDTAHLSMLEHGAYGLLLDRYYSTESGIPADQAHRLARARSKDERAAVDAVLGEFFTLRDGVWINCRAEREVERAQTKIKAARENGKAGGKAQATGQGGQGGSQEGCAQAPACCAADNGGNEPQRGQAHGLRRAGRHAVSAGCGGCVHGGVLGPTRHRPHHWQALGNAGRVGLRKAARMTGIELANAEAAQALAASMTQHGYLRGRVLPDGSVAALLNLLFTRAICLGCTEEGWSRRFCFKDQALADQRFAELVTEDDVPAGFVARRWA